MAFTFEDPRCPGCTACCRAPCLDTYNLHAPFTELERERLKTENPTIWQAVEDRIKAGGGGAKVNVGGDACQFLDEENGACLINDDKPDQCRSFEVDGRDCLIAIQIKGGGYVDAWPRS